MAGHFSSSFTCPNSPNWAIRAGPKPFLSKPDCIQRIRWANMRGVRCVHSINKQHEPVQQAQYPIPAAIDTVSKADYGKFVRFLHLASPYVVGHRGQIFVIVIPGEVMTRKERLVPLLEDILLLNGLGARLLLSQERRNRSMQRCAGGGRNPSGRAHIASQAQKL